MNLAALGVPVYFISAGGDKDPAWHAIGIALSAAGVTADLTAVPGARTHTKTRITCDGRQIARVDDEQVPLSCDNMVLRALEHIGESSAAIPHEIKLIVVADYSKGLMTDGVIRYVLDMSTARRIPVYVDAKPARIRSYAGASLLKPNLAEAMRVVEEDGQARPAFALPAEEQRDDKAAYCAAYLRQKYGFGMVVVTCGADGAVFTDPARPGITLRLPGHKCECYDVTGAGDTFMASMAAACLEGRELRDAVYRANVAAGLAVQKSGVVAITRAELELELYRAAGWRGKIMIPPAAMAFAERVQTGGKSVVLASGSFDYLHAGHIEMLRFAKQQGDYLFVAYSDDLSLRALKGASRPIVHDDCRASHLALLEPVDVVFRFAGDAEALVRQIRPNVLVRDQGSADAGPIPGADFVCSCGGRLAIAPATLRNVDAVRATV
jgi:D-beta-D-heptose 7-phosphate kinase/D-beta-D-heptose 1-phosphate adenosyltransferase